MESTAPLAPASKETEYATLREEVLKRIESRQQTISIAMTLAGAFLGIGWNAGSVVMLMYPIIALLLAVGWAQNEVFIKQLNSYIRDHLEGEETGLGWQRFVSQRQSEIRIWGWPLEIIAIGGIFVLTQIMAMGLGLYKFDSTLISWILLALDAVAVFGLFGLMNFLKQRSLV